MEPQDQRRVGIFPNKFPEREAVDGIESHRQMFTTWGLRAHIYRITTAEAKARAHHEVDRSHVGVSSTCACDPVIDRGVVRRHPVDMKQPMAELDRQHWTVKNQKRA